MNPQSGQMSLNHTTNRTSRTIVRSRSLSGHHHSLSQIDRYKRSILGYQQHQSSSTLYNHHQSNQPTIASLDLSSSLPIALVSIRNYLCDRLQLLEHRLKLINTHQARTTDGDVCCISSSDDDDEDEEEEDDDDDDEDDDQDGGEDRDADDQNCDYQQEKNDTQPAYKQSTTQSETSIESKRSSSMPSSVTSSRLSRSTLLDNDTLPLTSFKSPSNLQDFLKQLSNYVNQLKSDLFRSESSCCSDSLMSIHLDPFLTSSSASLSKSSLPLSPTGSGSDQSSKKIRLRHTISIPDPHQLLRSMIIHSENIQEALSQLTIFSNYSSRISNLPFMAPDSSSSTDGSAAPAGSEQAKEKVPSLLSEYFASESERLSSLLPNFPSGLTQSIAQSSNQITSALRAYKVEAQSVLHEGEMFIREEGEKLKDWVDAEAESLRLALQAGANRLLTYHELPSEWKNNRFIIGGYRFIPLDRWRDLLLSGLQWHNETINIHTHFFGALSLIYLLCFLWPTTAHTDPESSTVTDRLISLTFVMCAIKCLICSTAWHLFAGCGTLGPFRRLACVDYVGISGLIAASVVSAEYYGFYCRPELAARYIAFTALMGVIGMVLPFQPFFDRPESKWIRIVFFVSMASSFLIPQAHMSYLYGFRETINFYKPAFPSVISYLGGLFFYATNWPERIRPGWVFDTLFHSHQFWHVAIVIAIWLHWRAIGVLHDAGREGFSCSIFTGSPEVTAGGLSGVGRGSEF